MLKESLINAACDAHATWLQDFGIARVERFDRLRCSNILSASSEAFIGRFLRDQGLLVEPYEDLSIGGPDYCCIRSEQRFYVEVTSLETAAVERAIWIPDDPKWQGGNVGSMSNLIRTAVCNKVRQCSAANDAPILVAIGLHHSWASMDVDEGLVSDMLISDEFYTVPIAPGRGPTSPGYFATGLRDALFMEAIGDVAKEKRQPVAGVLVFGLGVSPLNVIGVVNGHAHRPFDPALLPDIHFGETNIVENRVGIRWHNRAAKLEGTRPFI